MGLPLERVFAGPEQERHTILDAPRWSIDGRERLDFNTATRRLARGPLSDLHARRRHPPAAPRARRLPRLQRLDPERLLRRIGRPADPRRHAADDRHRCRGRRGAAAPPGWASRRSSSAPTRSRPKYSERVFDPLWQAIVDTGVKLGLHPLPMWDQDGTSRGYQLPDIMAASCLGFPMDMISHPLRHDVGRRLRPLPDHADHDPRGGRRLAAVVPRALRGAPRAVRHGSRRRSGRPRRWRSSSAR